MDRRNNAETEPEPRCLARSVTQTSSNLSSPALAILLELIASVKAIDALQMWAWRLGDYRAVCAQHYPELKEANDRAFAASPFASVDVPAFFLQRVASPTPEKVRNILDEGRRSYAADFDRDPVEQKRAFCEV